ncbi:hypothetical protein DFH08DRAFT_911668 [Mycena albidolilacea]|uniref:Tyr recombinase domain-containing protein n=1 Tax=Mycena albidolilacea TaxID=1033008 RepID=A0AAD7AGJ1_9AGAR|nr:hypothetical protein DFH08DRAFT_911668 [Mycena albidolilacea]
MSFFVTYMCHFIKPDSVKSYLSGICNQLEDVFPNVRKVRTSALVRRTLKGSKHLFGKGVKRKRPLSTSDLRTVVRPSHDDMLFLGMMFTGFDGLMRLGELAWPDTIALRNWRKVILHNTVKLTQSSVGFFLPGHKADIFFEGNQIVIVARADPELNTVTKVEQYLESRDALFPHHPALFVREDGSIPTHSWFLGRLRKYFDKDIAGHSLRAGGTTSLAEAGIYMRKNPTLLQSMLFAGRSAHNSPRHIGALAFPTAPP